MRLTAGCRFYCTHVELRHTSPSFCPTAFPLLLPRSGKALNPCKVQAAPTVWGSECQDPHLHVLLRAHLPCFLWPKLEAHPPTPYRGLILPYFWNKSMSRTSSQLRPIVIQLLPLLRILLIIQWAVHLPLEWSTCLQFLLRL